MPRGRRPGPGTVEERAAARRERVRMNVQAFRRRQQGLKEGESPPKPGLRWIEATKWQAAYEETADHDVNAYDSNSSVLTDAKTSSISQSSDHASYSDSEDATALISSRSVSPFLSPDPGRAERAFMLSIFPNQFLPRKFNLPTNPNTSPEIRTPCAFWVTSAYSLASDGSRSPLSDVLLAASTAFAGTELGRNDFLIQSRNLYQRSLAGLRRQMQPALAYRKSLPKEDAAVIFLTAHACAIVELYQNRSYADMNTHLQGIGLLIRHQSQVAGRLPEIGPCLLEEYRLMEIFSLMSTRKLSTRFGSGKDVPSFKMNDWDKDPGYGPGRSIFSTFLEVADYIPLAMVKMDALKQRPSSADRNAQINQMLHTLRNVQARMERWTVYSRDRCFEIKSPDSDDSTRSRPAPICVEDIYDYDYACAWMFCLSFETQALNEMIEGFILLAESQSNLALESGASESQVEVIRDKLVTVGSKLVQMIQYFFKPEQGVIGRSLAIWPLEAVWSTLDAEWERLYPTDPTKLRLAMVNSVVHSKRATSIRESIELCKETAKVIRSYGLPLIKDRDR